MMKRNGQVIRQWRILQAMDHKQWFNLRELRDCLPKPRPHKRTIMRDLEGLSQIFPIQRRGGKPEGFEYRLRRPLTELLKK